MKILVRNLERTVVEAELLELFKQYGTVASCNLILDAATGKSKGFAFVEMPHAREAIKAIKGLNTLRLHGTGIRVNQFLSQKLSVPRIQVYFLENFFNFFKSNISNYF